MVKNNTINRRSVLKKVGIAGSASLLPATVKGSEGNRDVEEVSKTEINKIISSIKNGEKSSKILDYISNRGWTPQFEEGTYRQIVVTKGENFKLAVIPLSNSETETEGAFRWTSVTDEPTSANIVDTTKSEETSVIVRNGSITTVVDSYASDSTTNQVSPNKEIGPGGGGGDVCYRCDCDTVVSENCTNWNFDCLAIVATAWGLSCATGLVGCVIASGGNLALWVVGDNCNVCDNYEVKRSEVGYACEY